MFGGKLTYQSQAREGQERARPSAKAWCLAQVKTTRKNRCRNALPRGLEEGAEGG